MSVLNEKERFIIERRITSDEPMTLQEIAVHFSISRERVRQIEEGALEKNEASTFTCSSSLLKDLQTLYSIQCNLLASMYLFLFL